MPPSRVVSLYLVPPPRAYPYTQKETAPVCHVRCLFAITIGGTDQGSGLIGISGVGLAISPVPPSLMKT